jgi:3D (Asp-Asp-Asp) domain-containing protein
VLIPRASFFYPHFSLAIGSIPFITYARMTNDKILWLPFLALLMALLTLSGCSSTGTKGSKGPGGLSGHPKEMTVRVTVYWQQGRGSDRWTRRGQTSSGLPLVDRKTAAVDPKLIPYGSRIVLPEANNKELTAADTGGAVVTRRASRKLGENHPVVDVFFKRKQDALAWAGANPPFMKALIFADEPET